MREHLKIYSAGNLPSQPLQSILPGVHPTVILILKMFFIFFVFKGIKQTFDFPIEETLSAQVSHPRSAGTQLY